MKPRGRLRRLVLLCRLSPARATQRPKTEICESIHNLIAADFRFHGSPIDLPSTPPALWRSYHQNYDSKRNLRLKTNDMEKRELGNTDLELTALSFGASSMGAEFRQVNLDEAFRSVRVAIERGMNFIDTSPYYGRGMSEVLLGQVLPDIPRDSYYLGTKLGRYAPQHFDFSARRVEESVDISLERMRQDHLDIVLCHDLEYVEMSQIVNETIPALRKQVEKGKVRYIGVSGYPMKMFKYVLENADIDVILPRTP